MTEGKAQLIEFLRTSEANTLRDRDIADRFGFKIGVVRKARAAVRAETDTSLHDSQDKSIDEVANQIPADETDISEDPSSDGMVPEPHQHHGSNGSSPGPILEGSQDASHGVVLPGMRSMTLREIDLDSGTRVRDLDPATVDAYASQMEVQKSTIGFGQLSVWWIPEIERSVLTDGFHRYEASSRALGDDVSWQVNLRIGTLADAIQDAFHHNRKHGLRLSREDRTLIIRRILDEGRWGKNPSVSRIAEVAGESERAFVAEVRKKWYEENGEEVPATSTVTRGGVTYEQKVPKRARPQPDAVEDDGMDSGKVEPPDEKQRRIDEEYLQSIPVRAQIVPDLLESFDRAALARRDGQRVVSNANNWLLRYREILGPDHPLVGAYERMARLPQPIDLDNRPVWVVCQKCQNGEGLATGFTPDGNRCKTCKGTGFRMPGV